MNTKIPGFIEQFSKLIAIPTVSCIDTQNDMSNRPFVDQLASWLDDLGFSVEIMPVQEQPEKVNLIAVAGQGEGGLVLAGHTDTVPYDESGWNQDPFSLTELDNRLYGLGTSDMKCFFPIVMDVLRDFNFSLLKKPLYILATCDEESTMSGAKALANSERAMGRYALIGEPTGLKPINMHKGILFESIRLIGRAGHSSDPSLGRNALEGMNKVINNLTLWRSELQKNHLNSHFKIPYPTMNFGSIHGGDSPNRICGECELNIDIRFLPDMDIEELRASVRRQVLGTIDGTGLAVEFDRIFPGVPGMATDPDSDIVRTAERLAGEPAGSVAFGTEGPYLNSLGMETVILGPGDIDVAHQVNEYLGLERIEPMKKIIGDMIVNYCT
jgi:acetylornithine deacetylase